MKLEELLRTFIGIGSWIYRINLYETDSKGNTKYITDHHMIDYYIDMDKFKDWFDMKVENFFRYPLWIRQQYRKRDKKMARGYICKICKSGGKK